MESRIARNIIILRNLNSPDIEQAIFILKKGNDEYNCEDGIVDEAQKIIDDFIKRRKKINKKQNRIKALLIITPIISAIALLSVMLLRFF